MSRSTSSADEVVKKICKFPLRDLDSTGCPTPPEASATLRKRVTDTTNLLTLQRAAVSRYDDCGSRRIMIGRLYVRNVITEYVPYGNEHLSCYGDLHFHAVLLSVDTLSAEEFREEGIFCTG